MTSAFLCLTEPPMSGSSRCAKKYSSMTRSPGSACVSGAASANPAVPCVVLTRVLVQGWDIYDNPIEGKLLHNKLEVFLRSIFLLLVRFHLIAARAVVAPDISEHTCQHKHSCKQRPTNVPTKQQSLTMMCSSGLPASLGLVYKSTVSKQGSCSTKKKYIANRESKSSLPPLRSVC